MHLHSKRKPNNVYQHHSVIVVLLLMQVLQWVQPIELLKYFFSNLDEVRVAKIFDYLDPKCTLSLRSFL
jgi:hypothetical protein